MNLFTKALQKHNPLKVIGVINAYLAKMAEKEGAAALYLSGAGVANYAWALPDVGLTTLEQVAEEVTRIRSSSSLPLLVDIDTGWDKVKEAVHTLHKAGASAIHIEDQIFDKKCGHLPGKRVVPIEAMCERLHEARYQNLFLVARTDAYETEGIEGVIARAKAYEAAGADMIFADALPHLDDFKTLHKNIGLPLLINQTEFGVTPLYAFAELKKAKVDAILYPLSLARAMMAAAKVVLKEILTKGDVKEVLTQMQPRKELYDTLDYR